MDYNGLTTAYRDGQKTRVSEDIKRINKRSEKPTAGRVVPEAEDISMGTGRRLSMAVLFLDLCKFSGRPSETAEEQFNILVSFDLFFSEMVRIAEDYGGTVEKNTGDGLMVYFEDRAGSPDESGSQRAVTCALTMVDTTEAILNPLLKDAGHEELHFRIGIDKGVVTIAKLGAAKRFNARVAIGTAANVACKILAKASAGEIIIGETVVLGLPVQWRTDFCRVMAEPSGWIYRKDGRPYPFYRYTGRWVRR